MKSRKKYILLAVLILLITVLGATYAYFVAQKGSGGSAQIEVGAGTTDLLSFTNGNKINIVANQDNFKKDDDSITEKSSVTATLTPNNTTNIAHDTYNVYLIIENNDLEYTTSDLKPELVLKVTNPLGEEVTEMKGFNYNLNQGFDITNKKRAAYPIIKGYEINADGEAQVDKWQIEVTLVNLETDQNANTGKTFTGSVLITSKDVDTYDLTEIKNMVSSTTYKSITSTIEYNEGVNNIDKYYFAIEATDEEPMALALTSVADALSHSYHESNDATYEFTTTDDGEKLKANQNYKIFSYAKDTEGYQSNIYETIVTTDNYEIPVIDDVTYSITPTSITVNVSSSVKSADIIGYQYSQNNGDDWTTTQKEATYVFKPLNQGTVYEIAVRAIDAEENPSNPWHESITTGVYGTEAYPYPITTIEDLVDLSNSVGDGNSYAGEYFTLYNDLDFQNKENYKNPDSIEYKDINGNGVDETLYTELTTGNGFNPIGNDDNKFKGNFNGGNFTINNLYIYSNEEKLLGLFGFAEGSKISNLNINGKIISDANPHDSGAIAGRASKVSLENVVTDVSVELKGSVHASGGIIGALHGGPNQFSNCTNNSNVSGGVYAGGIVGWVGANIVLTFNNVVNTGTVSNNYGPIVGGLIGLTRMGSNVTINNSHNSGVINETLVNEADKYVGGLIGENSGNTTINKSYNSGAVNVTRKSYEKFVFDNIGGIVGGTLIEQNQDLLLKINESYNAGNIAGGLYTGGIIGIVRGKSQVIIDKSYNNALVDNVNISITATSRLQVTTGGIIGYTENSGSNSVFILNSYNNGNVNGYENTAGFIAFCGTNNVNTIINSYNAGNITYKNGPLAKKALGIVHIVQPNSKLINVYNKGTISGNETYGIADGISNASNIVNAYYLNNVSAGGNLANIGTSIASNVLNNQSYLTGSTYFFTALNNNKNSINLNNINTLLNGYTLSAWKKSKTGYPVLDYQNE